MLQPRGTATKPPVSAAHWQVVSRLQGTSCHQDLGTRPAARGAPTPSDTPGRHQGCSAGPRPFLHPLTHHRFVERAGGRVYTHTRTCVSHSHTPHPPGTLRASGKESEDFPGPLCVVSGTPLLSLSTAHPLLSPPPAQPLRREGVPFLSQS